MPANLENSAVVTGLENVIFHCLKISALSNNGLKIKSDEICQPLVVFFSQGSILAGTMLKILQARLQQYVNGELPDVQADFRKGRGTRDQIANIRWIMEKARELQKHLFLLY